MQTGKRSKLSDFTRATELTPEVSKAIDDAFEYHPWTAEQVEAGKVIRAAKKAKQHTASFLRPGKFTGNAGSGLEPNKDASLSRVAKRRAMFESAFKDISTRFLGEKRSVRRSIARDLSKRMFRGEEAVVRKDN
jgi:hypothetical protein